MEMREDYAVIKGLAHLLDSWTATTWMVRWAELIMLITASDWKPLRKIREVSIMNKKLSYCRDT